MEFTFCVFAPYLLSQGLIKWISGASCGGVGVGRSRRRVQERGGHATQVFVGMPPRDEAKEPGGAVRVPVGTLQGRRAARA